LIEEELSCTVCCEIYKDHVVLKCSHSKELRTVLEPLQKKLETFYKVKTTCAQKAEYNTNTREWECHLEQFCNIVVVCTSVCNKKYLYIYFVSFAYLMKDFYLWHSWMLNSQILGAGVFIYFNYHYSKTEELTTVRFTAERRQLPDNPERFEESCCVLGAEGFSSGKQCWDVDVGDRSYWWLEVAKQSSNRKESFTLHPTQGFWTICLGEGKYTAQTSSWTVARLTVKRKPQKLKTERLFPFFWFGGDRGPLRIFWRWWS
ncbi:A33 protein, partial [Amia calva]|nr:A33 protein [Amia calva]